MLEISSGPRCPSVFGLCRRALECESEWAMTQHGVAWARHDRCLAMTGVRHRAAVPAAERVRRRAAQGGHRTAGTRLDARII